MIRRRESKVVSNPPKSDKRTKAKGQVTTGLKKDVLTPEVMAALYGYTKKQMDVDPEFRKLFDDAVKFEWTGEVGKANFLAALQNTKWYKTHNESVRTYLLAAADPTNLDFIEKKKDSTEYVRKTAQQMGVALDQTTLDDLTTQSMMNGWGTEANAYELQRAIIKTTPGGLSETDQTDTTDYIGDIGKQSDDLKAIAIANGVDMSDGWFNSAAKSIASNLTQPDFWQQKLRQQAASLFPVFADQINAGVNAAEVASPYMDAMAKMWDMNPAEIKLNDPMILGALTNYDDKGKPYAINMGEFRDRLRKDERWLKTDAAQNQIAGITNKVMEMFGLVG